MTKNSFVAEVTFKYSFFPSTLNDWFSLDINIRNSELILLFKSRLLFELLLSLTQLKMFKTTYIIFLTQKA